MKNPYKKLKGLSFEMRPVTLNKKLVIMPEKNPTPGHSPLFSIWATATHWKVLFIFWIGKIKTDCWLSYFKCYACMHANTHTHTHTHTHVKTRGEEKSSSSKFIFLFFAWPCTVHKFNLFTYIYAKVLVHPTKLIFLGTKRKKKQIKY